MNRIELLDGGYLYYDKGRFDKWCVYKVDLNGTKTIPKDVDYFEELYKYTKVFKNDEIYNDFIKIYDLTSNKLDNTVVDEIKKISVKYGNFSNDIFRIFSTIYMGMIAEENKKNTKLGKRIKRLGVYYLLVKLETPEYCANFMKNKTWIEIDNLCQKGGF